MLGAVLALAVAAVLAAVPNAFAKPSYTTPCNGCHSGPSLTVTATLVSNNGTTATYNVGSTGANAIAVFSGSTKLTTISSSTGQFSVPTGKTYTVYAVKGPGTSSGIGSTSVSPVAPAADTAAPTTTSDARASYVASATIRLTAADNTGGSGVAATYYKLDGGAQTAGHLGGRERLGAHTLEFWSVDVAGNAEAHKTASFTIAAPPVVDATAPTTTSDSRTSYVASATIRFTAVDNVGGSGIAATYYKLDGGAQTAGTTIVSEQPRRAHDRVLVRRRRGQRRAAQDGVLHDRCSAGHRRYGADDGVGRQGLLRGLCHDQADGSRQHRRLAVWRATYYKLDGGAQTAGTSDGIEQPRRRIRSSSGPSTSRATSRRRTPRPSRSPRLPPRRRRSRSRRAAGCTSAVPWRCPARWPPRATVTSCPCT